MNWLRVQTALLDAAGAVAAFAANWFLQSTLLIAAGLGIAWLARRRGAAEQSAIYRTTLAAVLVCPLATLLFSLSGVSGWSLPMPATWDNKPTNSSLPAVAPVPSPALEVHDDFDDPTHVGWDKRVERAPAHHAERWHVAQPPSAVVSQDRPPQPHPQAGTRAVLPAAAAPRSAADVREPSSLQVRPFGYAAIGIAVVWLLGSALLLARLTILWRRLTRLLRAAMPAESLVQEACRQAAALVGVAAPEVLSSPYLASPCVVGWPRRAVLLPEVSRALPLRDVLIHDSRLDLSRLRFGAASVSRPAHEQRYRYGIARRASKCWRSQRPRRSSRGRG